VSRYHCEIEWDGSEIVIHDSGSIGGTLVNGVKITLPTVLRSGDTVQVGETLLRVSTGEGATVTLRIAGDAVSVLPAAA